MKWIAFNKYKGIVGWYPARLQAERAIHSEYNNRDPKAYRVYRSKV